LEGPRNAPFKAASAGGTLLKINMAELWPLSNKLLSEDTTERQVLPSWGNPAMKAIQRILLGYLLWTAAAALIGAPSSRPAAARPNVAFGKANRAILETA
jgi:hypothetical protein